MDKLEKMRLMDKMIRELEDLSNSQTSLLKKITQLEADNINLGNNILEKGLAEVHEKIDEALTESGTLQSDFVAARNKFVTDNRLDQASPEATVS